MHFLSEQSGYALNFPGSAHTVLPRAALTQFEVGGIAFRRMESGITEDNHLIFKLPNEPLIGHTPTACIALSFGLILVLRGLMCSLRALASNATVASGLWTMAACHIKSIFSSSTCR